MVSNKVWLFTIISGWALIAAASSALDVYRDFASADRWFDVRSISVSDGTEAAPPRVAIDRTIHKPFLGYWHAAVRKVSDGTNSAACLAEGGTGYSTDAKIPPDAALDWVTQPEKCELKAGKYRLDILWRILPDGYPEKRVYRTSNVFEIRPSPG